MSDVAEQAVVRAAIERGYLRADELRQALLILEECRRVGEPAHLLSLLRLRYLSPECLPELTAVYHAAVSGRSESIFGADATLPSAGILDQVTVMSSRPPGQDPEAVRRYMKSTGARLAVAGLEQPSPRFGPYELEAELGRGGMGVVYRARHVELGRAVALKQISSHAAKVLVRFEREAQAVAQLDHPNVVRIHAYGEIDGTPYLVMDLVEGESLAARLKRDGPLEPREAARLIRACAEAMEHAHARGILHRDLKPANLLVGNDGQPKITDFGLARDDRGTRLTETGEVLGTPAYMSPEQADGNVDAMDARTDVYALGATLYALLTGRPPFQGGALIHVIRQVLQKTPAAPSQHRPGLDVDLDTICLKCLEKEPERRYQSAKELADELRRYEQGDPIRARPVGRAEGAARWLRRLSPVRKALMGIGGVLAIGALSLFAYTAWARSLDARQEALRRALETEEQERAQLDRAEALRAEAKKRTVASASDRRAKRVDVLLREGKGLFQNQEYARALDKFEEAAQEDSACVDAYRGRAACQRKLKNWEAALIDSEHVLKARPGDYASLELRATALRFLGRWKEALVALDRAEAVVDGVEPEADAPLGYLDGFQTNGRRILHAHRAACYLSQSRYREAEGELTKAIGLTPEPPLPWFRDRGGARLMLGKLEGAKADLGHAIHRDPSFPEVRLILAQVLLRQGALSTALEEINQELANRPGLALKARTYGKKGEILLRMNRPAEAKKSLDRAIALSPKRSQPYSVRGEARTALRDLDGARADFDKAIELNPQREYGYWARGDFRLRRAEYQAAIEDFDRVRIQPALVRRARFSKGQALIGLGKFNEALDVLARCPPPHDAMFLFVRARAWRGLGKREKERLDLVRCLKMKADPRIHAMARALLKKVERR